METETILRVRLTPRGGRDALIKWEEETLYARVAAPPVEGAANQALLRLLSETLGVSKSRIGFQSGETGRDKTLRVQGLGREELIARVEAALRPKGETKGCHR